MDRRRSRRSLQSSDPPPTTGVTIGGMVYRDIDGDSVRDAHEPGVPGVTIQIRSCSNERMGSTRTNSIGEFAVVLSAPGCYYARLDVTTHAFSEDSDVNPFTGKTEGVELEDGAAKYWYFGIIPPGGNGINMAPTRVPSLGPMDELLTASFEPSASLQPSGRATVAPTTTTGPSGGPTASATPAPCIVEDVCADDIMSSAPILRSSFGVIFSLSTPLKPGDDSEDEKEYVRITSLSLRVVTPLLSELSSTNYQVWYRPGDYGAVPRGVLTGWSLVADGNSLGLVTPGMGGKDEEEKGGEGGSVEGGSELVGGGGSSEQEQGGEGGISQGVGGGSQEDEDGDSQEPGGGGGDSQGQGGGGGSEQELKGGVSQEGAGSPEEQGGWGGAGSQEAEQMESVQEQEREDSMQGAGVGGGERGEGDGRGGSQQRGGGGVGGETQQGAGGGRGSEQGGLQEAERNRQSKGGNEASNNNRRRALRQITFSPQTKNQSHQHPLILDTNFLSGVFPSDNNKYKAQPSTPLPDGGMETLNMNGDLIKTYLYKIPPSIFDPVIMPKFGGKVSFYVTLDRALMQYGDAKLAERDLVDVENSDWDPEGDPYQDMNLRVHVGEGVTSYPWSDIINFYQPRRFLGKVWYEQALYTPCYLHESYPSISPSEVVIPDMPDLNEEKEEVRTGVEVKTRLAVSLFLQQDINYVIKMDDEVQEEFRSTMMDFLNEEYVYDYCIWGTEINVTSQKLSLLVDRRRMRRLRQGRGPNEELNRPHEKVLSDRRRKTQTEITILQIEIFVVAVAYDDPTICPEGAIPATSTDHGNTWEETIAWIGIDYVSDNSDRLVEKLRAAHEYFDAAFTVVADSDLLTQKVVAETTTTTTVIVEEETAEKSSIVLIPIVSAAAGAAVLCLVTTFCFIWWRKRKKQTMEEPPTDELVEIPDNIVSGVHTDREDSDKPREEAALVTQVEIGEDNNDDANGWEDPDSTMLPLEEDRDELTEALPKLQPVPALEDTIMNRGLPRRLSEPNMATILSQPIMRKQTRSIGCIRELWINLNKESSGGYLEEMLHGMLYPIDDPDLLYWEREKHIMGEDPHAPYVPYGAAIENTFIDEDEAFRIKSPWEAEKRLSTLAGPPNKVQNEPSNPPKPPNEALNERRNESQNEAHNENSSNVKAGTKIHPLVIQQVEMLETKWKQLREEYDGDNDEYSDDEIDLENFDVNNRIEQLMGHIEKLEVERKMRLAELKRQEEEEEELARKRMVRAGEGINYSEEFSKDFVIRSKAKKKKKIEDIDLDELSESSSEEEQEDGEYDIAWMRLKVPLAAQNPEAMKSMVKKGKGMD